MKSFQVEFLDDDQFGREVSELYWGLDDEGKFAFTVADIASEYGIASHKLSDFAYQHSAAKSTSIECKTCVEPFRFRNRSDVQQRSSYRHVVREYECDACQLYELERQRVLIREFAAADVPVRKIEVSELTFLDAIALSSALSVGTARTGDRLSPGIGWFDSLTPNWSYSLSVVKDLFHRDFLRIDPDSPANVFVWSDGKPDQFYVDRVGWVLPVIDDSNAHGYKTQLDYALGSGEWPESWSAEITDAHKTLAKAECIGWFEIQMRTHGFDGDAPDELAELVGVALNDFPASQVNNLLWRAARDCAAFYMRKEGVISRATAAKAAIRSFGERGYERALEEGWNIKDFDRNYAYPPSEMSRMFAAALNISDKDFLKAPIGTLAIESVA